MASDIDSRGAEASALKLVALIIGAGALALVVLGLLTVASVFDAGVKVGSVEIGAGLLGMPLAYWVGRLRRQALFATRQSSDSALYPLEEEKPNSAGLLTSGKRWIVVVTLVGAAVGYAFGRDIGLALIGAIAGAVIGTLSILVPLESVLAEERRRKRRKD